MNQIRSINHCGNDQQRGYLLISAVILIVVVGFLATTVAYLVSTEAHSSAMHLDSLKAFYIARSGIEKSADRLLSRNVASSQRMACESGSDGILNYGESIFEGAFLVTDRLHQYLTDTWLARSINANTVIIPVNSLNAFQDNPLRGRVMIDRELIDYRGLSNDETVCGDSARTPCLIDVTRGVGGSDNVYHALGTTIAQNACLLTVEGGVPDLTSLPPAVKRRLVGEVKQLEEGWSVGNVSGYGNVLRWNGKRWRRLLSGDDGFDDIPAVNLNDIEALSYADVWAVGQSGSIVHWNGEGWFNAISGVSAQLNSVSCEEGDTCYAVGNNRTFLELSGGSWGVMTPDISVPTVHFNAVDCHHSNNCRAVGEVDPLAPNKTVFVELTGGIWSRTADSNNDDPSQELFGIACPNDTNCYAVGNGSTFMRFDGVNWTSAPKHASIPASVRMNDVTCLANNDCWAVGNNSTFAYWNGSVWSRNTSFGGSTNFNAITCVDSDDCWAVGDNGTIAHWNGSTWGTGFATSNVPGVSLKGICLIANHQQCPIPWHEHFG